MASDYFGLFPIGGDQGVRVLVKGAYDGAMKEGLLNRLERRGKEYEIPIFVFFAEEVVGGQEGAAAAPRIWAHDEGVISEQCRLEEWA
jgi:hypothetical protein